MACLFTHQFHYHPQVPIGGVPIPLNKNPKILGVTLDPLFTFSPHIAVIASKAASKLKILRALVGQGWGQSKETLINTYKALILPHFTYAVPVWGPNARDGAVEKLQVIQNQALRIAIGCHRKSPIQHLHQEAKLMRVGPHNDMLCAQFLASAMRPHHPSFAIVQQPLGPRVMKHTLSSKFGDKVAPLLQNGIIPQSHYRETVKRLHTDAVTAEIEELNRLGDNKVLLAPPPLVNDKAERKLARPHRSLLAQLRSGYSSSLRSYLMGIGKTADDNCPECGVSPHDVAHLFSCLSAPTNLSTRDLWTNPVDVILFLSSLPSFSFLPPLPPPPPEPPP